MSASFHLLLNSMAPKNIIFYYFINIISIIIYNIYE